MLFNYQIYTTRQNEMVNITGMVNESIAKSGVENGICVVFNPHTTAAITINEGTDPDVLSDMLMELGKIVPHSDGYKHFEGNSAAHIKSSLFKTSTQIILCDGKPLLGMWQAIYFCEFDGPRNREFYIKILQDPKIEDQNISNDIID